MSAVCGAAAARFAARWERAVIDGGSSGDVRAER